VSLLALLHSAGIGDSVESGVDLYADRIAEVLQFPETRVIALECEEDAFTIADAATRSYYDTSTFLNRAKEVIDDNATRVVADTSDAKLITVVQAAAHSYYQTAILLRRVEEALNDETAQGIAEITGAEMSTVAQAAARSSYPPATFLKRAENAAEQESHTKYIALETGNDIFDVVSAAADSALDPATFLGEALGMAMDDGTASAANALEYKRFALIRAALGSGRQAEAFLDTAQSLLKDTRTTELAMGTGYSPGAVAVLAAGAEDSSKFLESGLAALQHDEINAIAETLGFRRAALALAIAHSNREPEAFLTSARDVVEAGSLGTLAGRSGWSLGAEALIAASN
jgi:hypothetical protein